jgi:signal transduction histidine kinase
VPGLYAWLRRHPRVVDGALALLLLGLGVSAPTLTTRELVNAPFILGLAVPVVFRRERPALAFAFVIAAGAAQVLILPRPIGSDLSVVVMLYTLAAYQPRRVSLRGLAICLAGTAVAVLRWHPHPPSPNLYDIGTDLAVFAGPPLFAWLLGDSVRWRRGYYQALEERASRLERERDAQAQIAAAAERARIARELHDVVAHNVSVMVVQADGAAFALDTSPQRTREALAAISATGRRALAEMRSLLGVLRDSADPPGAPAAFAPQPGIGQLGELLDQARAAGLPVSLTVSGEPRPVPEGEALAAYRVVQESLTNIRKHAGPGAAAAVDLSYSERGLAIRVTDDGRGAAAHGDPARTGPARPAGPAVAGHGLAGMRERIELYGGTVRSGPRTGGGYEVVAELPLALEPA